MRPFFTSPFSLEIEPKAFRNRNFLNTRDNCTRIHCSLIPEIAMNRSVDECDERTNCPNRMRTGL